MRDSDIDALSADGAQEAQPRTAAGRRLFTDNEPMDMFESDGVTWEDVCAIEAEAAEPAPLDANTIRQAVSLARAIHSGEWYREAKKSLSEGVYPTWAQVIALVDRLAAGDKGSDR